MHRSDTPTRWSLASLLLILILILPVTNVHAAGAPTDAETPISPTPISPSSLPGIGYYYTVQPTDTLWDIAVAHGISVETLVAANTQVDPKRLLAGQTIFVPAQPAVVPRKPTPAPPVAPAPTSTPLPETTAAPAQEAGQTPAPADAPPPEPAPVDAPLPEPTPVDTAAAPTPEPAPPVEEVAAPEPSGWQAEILELINGKRICPGIGGAHLVTRACPRGAGPRRRLRPAQPGQPRRLGRREAGGKIGTDRLRGTYVQRKLGQRAKRPTRVRDVVERTQRPRPASPQHPEPPVHRDRDRRRQGILGLLFRR